MATDDKDKAKSYLDKAVGLEEALSLLPLVLQNLEQEVI